MWVSVWGFKFYIENLIIQNLKIVPYIAKYIIFETSSLVSRNIEKISKMHEINQNDKCNGKTENVYKCQRNATPSVQSTQLLIKA